MAISIDILSPEALKKAGEVEIFDENGTKIKFGSLYADQKALIIFIRHFFCGNCMEYIRVISEQIKPEELAEKGISLHIIGCGEYSFIKNYADEAQAKFPIYAEPTQKLHKILDLARNLALGKKPDYMSFGVWGGIKWGVPRRLAAGSKMFKGGDDKQNGGEFLLGPGNVCTWGHRMETTRDHVEVPELRKAVGLDVQDTARPSEATVTEDAVKPVENGDEPVTIPAAEPEAPTTA